LAALAALAAPVASVPPVVVVMGTMFLLVCFFFFFFFFFFFVASLVASIFGRSIFLHRWSFDSSRRGAAWFLCMAVQGVDDDEAVRHEAWVGALVVRSLFWGGVDDFARLWLQLGVRLWAQAVARGVDCIGFVVPLVVDALWEGLVVVVVRQRRRCGVDPLCCGRDVRGACALIGSSLVVRGLGHKLQQQQHWFVLLSEESQ